MRIGLFVRLSVMMLLQYMVWGNWLPFLAQFMGNDGIALNPGQQGIVFSVYGLGAILGPFFIGQLADRYFATERVLAACHAIGGVLLIVAAYTTSFVPLFLIMLIYCHLYMPTIGLTNSISFRSLGDGNQDKFAYIRAWGTAGWIIIGLGFGAYLGLNADVMASRGQEGGPIRTLLEPLFNLSFIGEPTIRDCLRLPGVLSIIYALYCLTLPHTPPVPSKNPAETNPFSAIIDSLQLMRNRSYAVLIVISGLVGIMLAFYFGLENFFLGDLGTAPDRIGPLMTIGQVAELGLMFSVPIVVAKLGIKKTMIIGASAWALRFGLSAIGEPYWLMVSTIALHGFAFGYFFVPGQMYVDKAASGDIKASAQSFLIFIVYGLGTIFGSFLSGAIRGYFSDVRQLENGTSLVENTFWAGIWLGPTILTILCILAFAFLFRDSGKIETPADHDPSDLDSPIAEPDLKPVGSLS